MLKRLKYIMRELKKSMRIYNIMNSPEFQKDRILGEIIRNTHSIEKGLSLKSPRLGFGYGKIKELMHQVEIVVDYNDANPVPEEIMMAMDAIEAYLLFHKEKQFINNQISEIELMYKKMCKQLPKTDGSFGGVCLITKDRNVSSFEELVLSRHSVRNFSGEKVSIEKIRHAVEIAMHCPSACNRQGYRVYMFGEAQKEDMKNWLSGVGGFADEIDKYLLITSKVSSYRLNEFYQHNVSATVFASFLLLALHNVGVGACFIQRDVMPNTQWDSIREKFGISGDELPTCMIGIGIENETTSVPMSHRLSTDRILKMFIPD